MMRRLNHEKYSDMVMLIVNFEKEKGLELSVRKCGHQRIFQVSWDKKIEMLSVRQLHMSLWDVILKKLRTVFGSRFHPHHP